MIIPSMPDSVKGIPSCPIPSNILEVRKSGWVPPTFASMSLRTSVKECIPGPSQDSIEASSERKEWSSVRAVVFPSPQGILGNGLMSGNAKFDALAEHMPCRTKSKAGPIDIFLGILRSAIREDLRDSNV